VGQVLVDGGTGKLKALLVGLISLGVSGCGLLPVPLSYINYGWMAYDANQMLQDEATTTDTALGLVMDMDCKVLNVLDGDDICARKEAKNEHDYLDAGNHSDSICTVLQ